MSAMKVGEGGKAFLEMYMNTTEVIKGSESLDSRCPFYDLTRTHINLNFGYMIVARVRIASTTSRKFNIISVMRTYWGWGLTSR